MEKEIKREIIAGEHGIRFADGTYVTFDDRKKREAEINYRVNCGINFIGK